jgi:hypothetical protein
MTQEVIVNDIHSIMVSIVNSTQAVIAKRFRDGTQGDVKDCF